MKTYPNRKSIFLTIFTIFSGYTISVSGQDVSLGKVEIQVTGAEISMPYFKKGLLLLYNFQYEAAQKEFDMAQLMDPDMVMAYWGEAMCYYQGVWHEEDYKNGRGVLYKLALTAPQRLEKANTDLEKGFIKSLDILFAKDETLEERHEKYLEFMKSFDKDYPENAEVSVSYALALLERMPAHLDDNYGALAQKVLQKVLDHFPDHPGALNLMIHASDAPQRAYKGLFAAEHYPLVVKNLPYALHLPSHIYLDLGKWPEMVVANEQAWNLSEKIAKMNKLKIDTWDYHIYWWLFYGYLQEGRYDKAAEMVRSMHQYTRYAPTVRMRYFFAMMKAAYLVETGNWTGQISGMDVLTAGFNLKTKVLCFYVDGMAALAKGDVDKASWIVVQITDQKSVEMTAGGPEHPDYYYCGGRSDAGIIKGEQDMIAAEVMRLELEAALALKKNEMEKALDFAKSAAQFQDKVVLPSGPPIIAKPAHELYGEILLEAGNAEVAILQFDRSLLASPNRTRSLFGKFRAYRKLGQKAKMEGIKNMIITNWLHADAGVANRLNQ